MTNKLAVALGGLILLALLADLIVLDGSRSLFLAKKLADLIEWLAVWR